jgi:hypothetical protein
MQVSDLFGHRLAERVEYLEKYADFESLKASFGARCRTVIGSRTPRWLFSQTGLNQHFRPPGALANLAIIDAV